jgi:hypothetical protein
MLLGLRIEYVAGRLLPDHEPIHLPVVHPTR